MTKTRIGITMTVVLLTTFCTNSVDENNDGDSDKSKQSCSDDCGPLEECWDGQLCVAKTVGLSDGYSIDATEVTRHQYAQWLSTEPQLREQPDFCSDNRNFEPSCEWPADSKGDHPVVCVNWCSAYMYCDAVGKKLCGKIGGMAADYEEFANASISQWYNACSSGGQYEYPYGNEHIDDSCNGKGSGKNETEPVGSMSSCQSHAPGYEGIYDLSGNVAEWVFSCDDFSTYTGYHDNCRQRGGSFFFSPAGEKCAGDVSYQRNRREDYLGFRCCSQ